MNDINLKDSITKSFFYWKDYTYSKYKKYLILNNDSVNKKQKFNLYFDYFVEYMEMDCMYFSIKTENEYFTSNKKFNLKYKILINELDINNTEI